MDNSLLFIIGIGVAAVVAFACYRVADRKGRNAVGYAVLGFFLPLIGIIAVLVVGPRERSTAS